MAWKQVFVADAAIISQLFALVFVIIVTNVKRYYYRIALSSDAYPDFMGC